MWTLGGTRIYVQDINDEVKQIIARLQPVSGGSVHQVFGYESPIYRVSSLVVGSGNVMSLRQLTTDGVTHELVSPEGSLGNFFVTDVKAVRQKTSLQFIDLSQDCETPVYQVDFELYFEDTWP